MGLIDKLVFFSALGLFGVFAYYFFVPRLGSLIPQPLQQYIPIPQQQQQPAPTPAPQAPIPKGEEIIPSPAAPPPKISTTPGAAFTFNIVGDSRPEHTATGNNVCSGNPTLVLLTGDFMQGEANASQWQKTYSACAGKQVFASRGNHDGSGSDFLKIFTLNKGSWSAIHKQGKIAFIAVDTIKDNPASEDNLFQNAQNDPNIKHIVVIMHEPNFIHPSYGASSDSSQQYHQMFKKYSKVKMVVAGHNHLYSRFKPIDGILYITNGTGGASGGGDGSGTYHKGNGCLKCSADANGAINCKWVSNSGKIGDQFSISADGRLPADGEGVKNAPSGSAFAQAFYTYTTTTTTNPVYNNNEGIDIIAEREFRRRERQRRKFNRYLYDYHTLMANSRRRYR